MAGEIAVVPARALMPRLRGRVVHPSGVGRRENQHVKRVAVLLVGIRQRVGNVRVLLDLPLNGVRRYALAFVAVGAVNNTAPAGVCA